MEAIELHKTVSRKHLTITVDPVQQGHAFHLAKRSKVTIEDLGAKSGTTINGQMMEKGASFVVQDTRTELILGKDPKPQPF